MTDQVVEMEPLLDHHDGIILLIVEAGDQRVVKPLIGTIVSRDNLDENGRRQSGLEAAAGSEVMIALGPEVRKHFFVGTVC